MRGTESPDSIPNSKAFSGCAIFLLICTSYPVEAMMSNRSEPPRKLRLVNLTFNPGPTKLLDLDVACNSVRIDFFR
jgi:hypothetical protein